MNPHRRSPLVGLALTVAVAASASAQDAVVLRIAEAPRLDGRAWSIAFAQEITFGGERGGATVLRDARVRVHLVDGRTVDASRGATVVVLDSARASVSSPHGREVIDLRSLTGTRTGIEYARNGGPATWPAAEPVLGFGELGGSLQLSALVDHIFPALDGRAVRLGDRWERTRTRHAIDGNRTTEQTVTTSFRLERIDGEGIAHIAFTTAVPSGPSARGTILLGVDDGIVHEVTLEETASGDWDMGGTILPYDQTTTVSAALVAAPAGR